MKIIDRKHLCTFITLGDQKIMKFLCLVLNFQKISLVLKFWPRLYFASLVLTVGMVLLITCQDLCSQCLCTTLCKLLLQLRPQFKTEFVFFSS